MYFGLISMASVKWWSMEGLVINDYGPNAHLYVHNLRHAHTMMSVYF